MIRIGAVGETAYDVTTPRPRSRSCRGHAPPVDRAVYGAEPAADAESRHRAAAEGAVARSRAARRGLRASTRRVTVDSSQGPALVWTVSRRLLAGFLQRTTSRRRRS